MAAEHGGPVRVALVGLLAAGHSGVPRYTASLSRALDGVAPEFPELELRFLTTAVGAEQVGLRQIEVELVRRPFPDARQGWRRLVTEQLASRRAAADLLHFFDLTGPVLAPRRPFTATIHDAAIRHRFERARVAHKQLLQPYAIARAAAVVGVSHFAAEEAVRWFGADERRLRVVPSGPGLMGGAGGAAALPDTPREPYLLYVGNLEVHKNLPHLVSAFAAAEVDARLLIVSGRGARRDEIEALAQRSPARERITFLSDVSDAQLESLYRDALALVLPSRYEGFGFTALEAMGRGCPVLASEIPALREVAGDGAWLLPLDDRAAWVAALRQVVEEPELRQRLRQRGELRVRQFSWEKTARQLCQLFLELAGRRTGASRP